VIALIDGDILAYERAAAAEERYDWNGDGKPAQLLKKEPEEVFAEVEADLLGYRQKLGARRLIVCLSDPKVNWRKSVYPLYKSNRTAVVKPLLLMDVKQHMLDKLAAYVRPSLEADDVMGILSTHPDILPGEKCIVSIDKDMKTIPGLLFNPDKDDEPRRISEQEADAWHLMQTLMGDTTDGYPGCPGIGPKRAQALLMVATDDWSKPEGAWAGVVAAFAKKNLNEQYALTQARIARICRHTDYDYEKKEVILWNPPAPVTPSATATPVACTSKPT
jgi:DNA polymerase-1